MKYSENIHPASVDETLRCPQVAFYHFVFVFVRVPDNNIMQSIVIELNWITVFGKSLKGDRKG
jgi:hypothetical protein